MSFQDQIKQQIEKLLFLMGVAGSVAVEEREGRLVFNITSEDSPILIGQYGANLAALQHLVRAMTRKTVPEEGTPTPFIIDVEGYRQEREEFLVELAKQAAERVRQTKQTLILKPMNAHDRFVIHTYFSALDDLETSSVGDDPERRIVIKLKA